MTAPDINEIVKRNGIDAGRAIIDPAGLGSPSETPFSGTFSMTS